MNLQWAKWMFSNLTASIIEKSKWFGLSLFELTFKNTIIEIGYH